MSWPSLPSIFALSVAGAVSIAVSGALAADASSSSNAFSVDWQAIAASMEGAARDLAMWAEAGYRRKPAVMIGLAGLVMLPVIALAGLLLHWLVARPAPLAQQPLAPASDMPRLAWLELGERPVEIRRDLVQIGRESDNDVCLDDSTVHRYHALIERTGEQGFVITDVSGPEGNGMRINGARASRARLAHGDVVELGKARMKFATAA